MLTGSPEGSKDGGFSWEHVMTAYLKGELAGEGIPVRRATSWVVEPSEEEFEGRVWWDTAVVEREVDRRGKDLGVTRSRSSG